MRIYYGRHTKIHNLVLLSDNCYHLVEHNLICSIIYPLFVGVKI